MCLQLFKLTSKEISPLVWSERDENHILQSVLGSLLQVVTEKVTFGLVSVYREGTAFNIVRLVFPLPFFSPLEFLQSSKTLENYDALMVYSGAL